MSLTLLSIVLSRTDMMEQREASLFLEKRASLQKAAGHRALWTTKLGDQHSYCSEKAKNSSATY